MVCGSFFYPLLFAKCDTLLASLFRPAKGSSAVASGVQDLRQRMCEKLLSMEFTSDGKWVCFWCKIWLALAN
jgi:hypothetical protein